MAAIPNFHGQACLIVDQSQEACLNECKLNVTVTQRDGQIDISYNTKILVKSPATRIAENDVPDFLGGGEACKQALIIGTFGIAHSSAGRGNGPKQLAGHGVLPENHRSAGHNPQSVRHWAVRKPASL